MSELKKARLGVIGSGTGPQQGSDWVDVQFNPTSLRVQISNKTAGGQQSGAQGRQRPGTGEMQVSFDLVFDSADEDGVDVLKKTAAVERFVRPRSAQPGQEAPPRVVFEWGTFQVQGVMESANLDIDFFDAGGTPLRAKVAVTIKGQDPRWAYTATQTSGAPSAGAGGGIPAGALTPPAGGSGGLTAGAPGTQGSTSAVDKVVQAMPGESLQQLASRMGLDPSAWRALSVGMDNPLKLSLGQEVSVPSGLSQGSASGQRTQGQDPARSTSRLPLLDARSQASSTASAAGAFNKAGAAKDNPIQQGQALAVQGGLTGTIAQARGQVHQQGAGQSRAAFGLGASAGNDSQTDTDSRPWGMGVPLRPRFGSGQSASRLDPTQPGWSTTVLRSASGNNTHNNTHNSATALRSPIANTSTGAGTAKARVSQAGKGPGCGCRGGRSRKTP
jgi:LysM repeat protein